MKPSIKIALGIFTTLAVMTFVVLWDQVFKDKLTSVDVVVVKAGTTIQPSEMIQADMLAVEKRNKQDLIANVIYPNEINKIIGKDAEEVIVGNSMVSSDMVDWDNLVPDPKKKEAIRPIPADWVYAIPGSLRRKDKITISTISDAAIRNLSLATSGQANNGSVITLPKTKISNTTESVVPILSGIRVEYAKDSSNNEVVGKPAADAKDNSNDTRYDASGNFNQLELLLTQDQFDTISNAVLNNHCKLYITYR